MTAKQKHVLLIEDDLTFIKFVKRILSSEGYEVISATNGRDGLVALRQHKPAVILLDMALPVMDGWAFLSVYNSQTDVKAPVIVISGGESDTRKLPPVAGILRKPFDVQALIDLVAHYTLSQSV